MSWVTLWAALTRVYQFILTRYPLLMGAELYSSHMDFSMQTQRIACLHLKMNPILCGWKYTATGACNYMTTWEASESFIGLSNPLLGHSLLLVCNPHIWMRLDQDMELRKGVFAFWWWKVFTVSSHEDYLLLMMGTGLVLIHSRNLSFLSSFGNNDFLVPFCQPYLHKAVFWAILPHSSLQNLILNSYGAFS